MKAATHEPGPRCGLMAEVRSLTAGLEASVAELRDVQDCLAGADAIALVEQYALAERIAKAGMLVAARRAKRAGAWRSTGERSPEAWLARTAGCSVSEAYRELRGIEELADDPQVEEALATGQVSSQKASEVAKAARENPDVRARLLRNAEQASLAETRLACRQAADDGEGDERKAQERLRRAHRSRYLRFWEDADGRGIRLDGLLAADAFSRLRAALRPFEEEIFDRNRLAKVDDTPAQRRADALVLMAVATTECPDEQAQALPDEAIKPDASVEEESEGHPGGESDSHPERPSRPGAPPGSSGRPPGQSPHRLRRPRTPATIIVRVDHAALVRGWREAAEVCEIDGVGPVPVATVRSMMSDAFLAAVVTDGVDIRRVVHLGRSVTATMRTALIARDTHCVVPGCGVSVGLEIDHVEGWSVTRVTRIDSLARLCHAHHAQKTYEGARLHGPPGQWRWIPPPGHTSSTDHAPPPDHAAPPRPPPAEARPEAQSLFAG